MIMINAYQRRRVVTTCEYIEKLVSEAEHILVCERPHSPFQRYLADAEPWQIEKVREANTLLRQAMQRLLAALDIAETPPDISGLETFITALMFAGVAFEELRPKYLRGYGELDEDASREIDRFVSEIRALIDRGLEEISTKNRDDRKGLKGNEKPPSSRS